jgi:hypothetical protein
VARRADVRARLRQRGSPVEQVAMEPCWQADPRVLPDAAQAVAILRPLRGLNLGASRLAPRSPNRGGLVAVVGRERRPHSVRRVRRGGDAPVAAEIVDDGETTATCVHHIGVDAVGEFGTRVRHSQQHGLMAVVKGNSEGRARMDNGVRGKFTNHQWDRVEGRVWGSADEYRPTGQSTWRAVKSKE